MLIQKSTFNGSKNRQKSTLQSLENYSRSFKKVKKFGFKTQSQSFGTQKESLMKWFNVAMRKLVINVNHIPHHMWSKSTVKRRSEMSVFYGYLSRRSFQKMMIQQVRVNRIKIPMIIPTASSLPSKIVAKNMMKFKKACRQSQGDRLGSEGYTGQLQ